MAEMGKAEHAFGSLVDEERASDLACKRKSNGWRSPAQEEVGKLAVVRMGWLAMRRCFCVSSELCQVRAEGQPFPVVDCKR
mmetsp:Transcript_9629/g.20315  ORF Transcript_9629/g.20315 Transcript_9629/m.20315 type:complete len:81 (+) Transcript_9629:900-1142(+)